MRRGGGGRRWYDLPGRALLVGGVVGTVVSVSRAIGPSATGIATVFPINISSMAIVIDLRLGAGMSAATVASAMPAMTGMTFAYLLLHLTVAPLGKWPALLGLAAGLHRLVGLAAGLGERGGRPPPCLDRFSGAPIWCPPGRVAALPCAGRAPHRAVRAEWRTAWALSPPA